MPDNTATTTAAGLTGVFFGAAMTPTEVAANLRVFNDWRRGELDDLSMPDPREISEAIDAAIEMIERVVQLEPQPYSTTKDHNWYYAQGWNDCLREMTSKESK